MAGEYRDNINPFDDEFEELFEEPTTPRSPRTAAESSATRSPRKRSKAVIILVILLLISLSCNIFFVIRDIKGGEHQNQQTTDQSNSAQQDGKQNDTNQSSNSNSGYQITQEEFELWRQYMMMIVNGEVGQSSSEGVQPPVGMQPNQTADDENQTSEPQVVCEKPQVILTENDYKDRVRNDTKVVDDATTALLDKGLWLNTEGKITVNLYGSVSKVYAAVGTEEYSEVQLSNAAAYSYFTYQVSDNEQVLFKLEMVDGNIYYFSVYDR